MSHLVPCPECDRHVLASDASCPFCGDAIDASVSVPGRPRRRLGRAATFAFGAAVAAATATTGCGESHSPDDDAGTAQDAGVDAGIDSGGVAPPYGIPPDPDGGVAPAYGAPAPDAGFVDPDSGFAPLYGGAPGD